MSYCVAVSIDQLLWYVDLSGYFLSRSFPVGVAKYLSWKETTQVTKYTCTHHLWTIPFFCIATKGMHRLSYPLSVLVVFVNVCLSRWLTPFFLFVKEGELVVRKGTYGVETNINNNGGDGENTALKQQNQQEKHLHPSHERKQNEKVTSKKNTSTAMCEYDTYQNNNNGTNEENASSSLLSSRREEAKIIHKKYLNINLSYELWKDINISILQINNDDPHVILYVLRLMWRWSLFNLLTFIFLHRVCSFLWRGECIV
mmetsp:Transcript_9296/g.11829  ORF Transcript_9296/g.11829 Transcript_9296/m.11829 type:complete len:257 (+) Transcript_9296:1-771(+)